MPTQQVCCAAVSRPVGQTLIYINNLTTPSMVKRKNGFAAPYSEDQMVSWVVYPLLVAAHLIVVGLSLGHISYQIHFIWVIAAMHVPTWIDNN